ncbi:hypothetical protein CDO26_19990 (plasmid) [Sinorhizobium meliloti]|uniref:hypothetical protein n=1 Tax=Rhizobium meliloti TaxID=382 RepID=UPI000B4970EC|nr:hypothetical protein [Sinorhizobium meliloti]ASP86855.1 hypothetical protein CDO26_19990 [Sinorhizobium meliloti]MQW25528.1 hypothetical protein [Sinorhizobium meliloti]
MTIIAEIIEPNDSIWQGAEPPSRTGESDNSADTCRSFEFEIDNGSGCMSISHPRAWAARQLAD